MRNSSINWIFLWRLLIQNYSKLSITEKRRNKAKYLTWNFIRLKACLHYFSLFLKDKSISSLVWMKYIEKKFTLEFFFFPLFHKHLFSPGLPHTTCLLETSCLEKITMCNWDNAHDVATCPDEWSMKRSELNKPSTNQDKHHKRSSNFCYTLNRWEHVPLNIKLNEIFFKKYLLIETFPRNNQLQKLTFVGVSCETCSENFIKFSRRTLPYQ